MSADTKPNCDRRHYPTPKNGCATVLLNWFLAFLVVSGVATPWGRLELDLFPPRVRLDVAPVGSAR
jgi:hypothetical protein